MSFLAQADAWAGVPVAEHLSLFSPMIALIGTMLAVVACPIVLGRGVRPVTGVVVVGVVITFLLSLRVAGQLSGGGVSGLSTDPGAGILVVDNLSVGFQLILALFLAGVMSLWWMGSAATERNAPEFFILLLGSALGMMLMTGTTNLLMIVLAIETASLPSYAIVGFDKRDRVGAEASLKYMIFGAISAAIMLYGASLLYGLVGSLSVADVAAYTAQQLVAGENRVLLSVGLLCFLAGIAFKISAVPFHFWCPDAFEGAKVEVTTWLSVASKAAGLVLLARLVMVFCSAVDVPVALPLIKPMAWAIGLMAAVTCTVGNFSAYKQTSVKRLLAYSSIAHAGYMMMAATVFVHPDMKGHEAGLSALLVYIVIYLFMNLGAFGVTAFVTWDTGSDNLSSFTGLWRRSPALALPMIICLVSLVGIPPMAGFIGKWWILVALGSLHDSISAGAFSFGSLGWFLIIVVALNTLFSLYYYMRVIVQMTLRDHGQAPVRAPAMGLALVNGCAVVLLVLFLMANPLKRTVDRFASGLFNAAQAARLAAPSVASAADAVD